MSVNGKEADAEPGETAPTENAGGAASPVEAVKEKDTDAPTTPTPFTGWQRAW